MKEFVNIHFLRLKWFVLNLSLENRNFGSCLEQDLNQPINKPYLIDIIYEPVYNLRIYILLKPTGVLTKTDQIIVLPEKSTKFQKNQDISPYSLNEIKLVFKYPKNTY